MSIANYFVDNLKGISLMFGINQWQGASNKLKEVATKLRLIGTKRSENKVMYNNSKAKGAADHGNSRRLLLEPPSETKDILSPDLDSG